MRDDATDLGHLPGEDGPPIIGNTLRFLRDPAAEDRRFRAQYGRLFRNRTFGRRVVGVADAELAEQVMLDRGQVLSSRDGWGHLLGPLFPRGLMLRDFADHRRHRQIMQAAFTRQALQSYCADLDAQSRRGVGAWVAAGQVTFYPAIKSLLLEMAAVTFLGVPLGDEATRLNRWFIELFAAGAAALRAPVPGSTWWRGLRARRRLVAWFEAAIPERRGATGTDLFTLLCNVSSEDGDRFTDDEIVDHMIFLMVAAHDTTASALASLLWYLLQAPDWAARLAAEADALGADAIDEADLERLPLLDQALREALRLNPPVRYIVRRTVEACPMGEHALPARCPVAVIVPGVHEDEALWADPLRFDPDRFAPGQARAHKAAWIPFGGGAHTCIGMRFALLQARIFLYYLLRQATVESAGPLGQRWRQVPVPMPVDGLPLRLTPRSPS
ncbi:MAG: cytochrome P450 [Myxococcales bacterium]|nr:cytochrome P450 [Myxococcales bacterium]